MYYLPKIIRKFKLRSIKNSKIDSKCKVLGGCTLLNVTMKQYSYIGSDATIINTEIGSFCSIAGGCMIGGGEHPIDHVSTSPVFHSGRNCLKINFANCEFQPYHKTIIGNDVWIGARCLIKGGVTIGDGAILAWEVFLLMIFHLMKSGREILPNLLGKDFQMRLLISYWYCSGGIYLTQN